MAATEAVRSGAARAGAAERAGHGERATASPAKAAAAAQRQPRRHAECCPRDRVGWCGGFGRGGGRRGRRARQRHGWDALANTEPRPQADALHHSCAASPRLVREPRVRSADAHPISNGFRSIYGFIWVGIWDMGLRLEACAPPRVGSAASIVSFLCLYVGQLQRTAYWRRAPE